MGLQSVPGIIKPYSKGVVQFLTKVPEKQKSKDSASARCCATPQSAAPSPPGAYNTGRYRWNNSRCGLRQTPRPPSQQRLLRAARVRPPRCRELPFSSTNYDRTL